MRRRVRAITSVFGPLPFRVALFYFRAVRRAAHSGDEDAMTKHTHPDSLATLLRLAKGRRRVAELGTAEGWTAVALALADGQRSVTTLDPFPSPTRETYLELAPRSTLRRIEFVQAFGEVEPEIRDVDFLFIDASHQRELTVRTFRAWQPALAPGAIVAFHDYDNPAYPGVGEAIAELGLEGEVHGDIFAWRAGSQ